MSDASTIELVVAHWSESVPGTVSKEQGEWLNVMLVNLLRKIEATGVEMPSVAVTVDGEWVHFGPRKQAKDHQ